MKKDFKNYLLPAILLLVGVMTGGSIARFGGWDILEPIIAATTLCVAAASGLRSLALERKLECSMEQKSFQLTLGLREGYLEGAPEHSFAEAEKAYREWMQQRVDGGLRFVTGLLDNCVLTFPVRTGESGFRVTQEPGAILSGSLSPHYDKGRSDAEVVATLNDLAQHLGVVLGQVRVYLSYCGRQWTVDIKK